MARAASACGVPYILSTMATSSIGEVAEAVRAQQAQQAQKAQRAKDAQHSLLWFQIYVMKRRDVTEWMVREVERLGYKALVVTVDAPRLGKNQMRYCLL